MPKAAQTVDYNDSGAWKYALVTGQGVGGPGNYDLLVSVQGGQWEPAENVPQGTESGHWREPQ